MQPAMYVPLPPAIIDLQLTNFHFLTVTVSMSRNAIDHANIMLQQGKVGWILQEKPAANYSYAE